MKRCFLLLVYCITACTLIKAQEQPIHQFAQICIEEREALLRQKDDPDRLFLALEDCYSKLSSVKLNLYEQSPYLYPSKSFKESDFEGHIQFSRLFVLNYLQYKISPYYSASLPFDVMRQQLERQSQSPRSLWERPGVANLIIESPKENKIILTHNALLDSTSCITYSYLIDKGKQYLVVITEDKTKPFTVVLEDAQASPITLNTDDNGIIYYEWKSKKSGKVRLTVTTPSEKLRSFVVAVNSIMQ